MSNVKIKAMYRDLENQIAKPRVHLSEHELFLVRLNLNHTLNTMKMLFSNELAAEGLSIEMIDIEMPVYEFMKDAKESEAAHV